MNLLRKTVVVRQKPRKVLFHQHPVGLVVPENVLPVWVVGAHGSHPGLGVFAHVGAGREPGLVDDLGDGGEILGEGPGEKVAG